MKAIKTLVLLLAVTTLFTVESYAQLLPQTGYQSPALSTSSSTPNLDIRLYDPNNSGGLLVQSSGDRSGYDYGIAARYLSSGATGTGTNYDGINSVITPNSDYSYWAGIRSVVNGDANSSVRAGDFRMNVTNGNQYDASDEIILAYAYNNPGDLTGLRLINQSTGANAKGLWVTHSGGDYAVHATGTTRGAYFSASDIGLNVNGRAIIGGNNTSENRLQVGHGLTRLGIGSAGGQDLNWGTSFVGFNAIRTSVGSWDFANDGANNGGSAVWGNVGGNIYFSTVQSTGAVDKTLSDTDMSNEVKMVVKGDGRVGIGTNQTPLNVGGTNITNYRLFVAGGILTEEVRVATAWADYVFDDSYDLPSLEKVEAHIEEKGHLIGVPSADEVESDGLGLAEITVKQQEKIEELFLYLIDLNDAVKVLQAENVVLKAALAK